MVFSELPKSSSLFFEWLLPPAAKLKLPTNESQSLLDQELIR